MSSPHLTGKLAQHAWDGAPVLVNATRRGHGWVPGVASPSLSHHKDRLLVSYQWMGRTYELEVDPRDERQVVPQSEFHLATVPALLNRELDCMVHAMRGPNRWFLARYRRFRLRWWKPRCPKEEHHRRQVDEVLDLPRVCSLRDVARFLDRRARVQFPEISHSGEALGNKPVVRLWARLRDLRRVLRTENEDPKRWVQLAPDLERQPDFSLDQLCDPMDGTAHPPILLVERRTLPSDGLTLRALSWPLFRVVRFPRTGDLIHARDVARRRHKMLLAQVRHVDAERQSMKVHFVGCSGEKRQRILCEDFGAWRPLRVCEADGGVGCSFFQMRRDIERLDECVVQQRHSGIEDDDEKCHMDRRFAPREEKPAQVTRAAADRAVAALVDMGFEDTELNLLVWEQHGGSMPAAINALLEMQ